MKFLVQYEKLPAFCFFCWCLGHEVTECGDGIHSKKSCGWGDWLRVPFLATPRREDARSGWGEGGVVEGEEEEEEAVVMALMMMKL